MKVYPEYLPASIRNESQRAAEIFIYDLLTEIETDDYCAFYSKDWECLAGVLAKSAAGGPTHRASEPRRSYPMGEIDFIILSPEGLLVLELRVVEFQLKKGLGLAQIEME
jgi:hypothetical protein